MNSTIDRTVKEVIELLVDSGGEQYFGEAVSKLEHALQCAWHAQQAGADEELVLAALLHDIGHLLDGEDTIRDGRVGVVNHDVTGARWLLARGFSARVARLVESHVDAKRYLTATNNHYMARLSPASRETLQLQGGPMTASESAAFEATAEFTEALRLRSWDEMAKDPHWTGPGIEMYRTALLNHLNNEYCKRFVTKL